MYEHKSQPLLPRRAFLRRQAMHLGVAGVLAFASLAIGVAGYAVTEKLGFVDAIYAATMILTGMGPARPASTDAGKLFASAYALFSAVVFLTCAAVLVAPIVHRVLHHVHLEKGKSLV